MLKKLDPRVKNLIQSLNVTVVSYDDCRNDRLYGFDFHLFSFTAGMYCSVTDRILINQFPPPQFKDINEVVLHELVHWTGLENRLNREPIWLRKIGSSHLITADSHATEELTAQYGMYLLAKQLGLDQKTYLQKFNDYSKYFINGDIELAAKQAKKAVCFINGLLAAKAA